MQEGPLSHAIENAIIQEDSKMLAGVLNRARRDEIDEFLQNENLIATCFNWLNKSEALTEAFFRHPIIRMYTLDHYDSIINDCAMMGYTTVLTCLCNKEYGLSGNDIAANHNAAFRSAASFNHLDTLKFLARFQAVADNAGVLNNDALMQAIRKNHIDVVKFLLTLRNVRENINAVDAYAVRAYSESHDLEMLDIIAQNGGDLNIAKRYSPTKTAIDDQRMANFLLIDSYNRMCFARDQKSADDRNNQRSEDETSGTAMEVIEGAAQIPAMYHPMLIAFSKLPFMRRHPDDLRRVYSYDDLSRLKIMEEQQARMQSETTAANDTDTQPSAAYYLAEEEVVPNNQPDQLDSRISDMEGDYDSLDELDELTSQIAGIKSFR